MRPRMAVVLLLIFLYMPWIYGQDSSDLPANFPEIRFNINPIYHSLGFKLGHILALRQVRPILSTFEGELMLGIGSDSEHVVDRECMQTIFGQGTSTRRSNQSADVISDELRARVQRDCALFTNPWRFSFLNQRLFDSTAPIKDKPVMIYYVNYYVSPAHLLMQTKNQALEIYATHPDLQMEPEFHISTWTGVNPENGIMTGRIVQASLEYPIRKTYEIILQEGENANNFRALSVSDGDLFVYITHAMLTGRQVRVEYTRLWGLHGGLLTSLFNYLTNMRVVRVQLLPTEAYP